MLANSDEYLDHEDSLHRSLNDGEWKKVDFGVTSEEEKSCECVEAGSLFLYSE